MTDPAEDFRRASARFLPHDLMGWLGISIGVLALIGASLLNWGTLLAILAMFGAQFVFGFVWSFAARCRRDGLPWRAP